MSRNVRLALDFAAGVPATDLAARDGISLPRVYQIVEKVRKDYQAPKNCSKEELGLLVQRGLHYPFHGLHRAAHDPSTPEQFYWAELASRSNNSE